VVWSGVTRTRKHLAVRAAVKINVTKCVEASKTDDCSTDVDVLTRDHRRPDWTQIVPNGASIVWGGCGAGAGRGRDIFIKLITDAAVARPPGRWWVIAPVDATFSVTFRPRPPPCARAAARAASNFGKTVIVELRLFAAADYRKRLMWIFGDDWRAWRRLACTERLIFTLLPRPPTNLIQTFSWTLLPWNSPPRGGGIHHYLSLKTQHVLLISI